MNNTNIHTSLPTVTNMLLDPKALQATVMAQAVRDPNAPKFMLTEEQEKQLMKSAVVSEPIKFDTNKVEWHLLPIDSVEEVVKVLQFGAQKYDAWNWAAGSGFKYTRLFNSTIRHLFAWARGEDLDPESGLSHISHACCNLLFLLHYITNKSKYTTNDDRVN